MSDLDSFQQTLQVAFELHNAGRPLQAVALCRSLMRMNPHDEQVLFLLGMVLQKTGRSREALKHLEMAATLEPGSARVFNALGFVHQGLHEYAQAVECYEKACRMGFRSADTYYSMGNACYRLGEIERATSLFQKAVAINPRDEASWNNLGKCLKESNRLEESIQAYDRAVAIAPGYAMACYGRAISLLAAGRLQEGFREYNQWRTHGLVFRHFPQSAWQGEPIPGKTLFLYAEQGFGDEIQYVRFVRMARERAGKVILECRPELKRLFACSDCAQGVIAYGEEIPPFDYYASLISLPGLLGTVMETIPGQTPYLRAASWENLPPTPAGHLKVGLVWAGNPGHENDAARSMRLEDLAPLRSLAGIVFYNLQQQVPSRDEDCYRSWTGLVDLRGGLHDFLDTAGAVTEMDLVISVDTSVAHLAGALAKPVWTLLSYSPDWRWFLERSDTPWYPTMHLFRQESRGDWQPVIQQVAVELQRLISRNAHPVKAP